MNRRCRWFALGSALLLAGALFGCRRKDLGCVEGAYSCSDSTLYLCVNAKNESVAACEGANGCTEGEQGVRCDQSEATRGSKCIGEGRHACARDHESLLVCVDGGIFEPERACGGDKKCTINSAEITCDDATAEVGDACEGHAVSFACNRARDAILKCTDRAYAVIERCASPRVCVISNDQIGCRAP